MIPLADQALCELLLWDTEFFGWRVGRVAGGTMHCEQAAEVDAWAVEERIRVIYFLARADSQSSIQAAEKHGYSLVDLRVTLECKLKGSKDQVYPDIRSAQAADIPALQKIARSEHGDARFFSDTRFPRALAEKLYATWIGLECAGRAQQVLVATAGTGQPLGYVSCHLDSKAHRGQIGLLAVAREAQGNGLGKALVASALAWFDRQGATETTVVTQGKNLPAQRLYQSRGFVTADVGLWYHKWFLHPPQPMVEPEKPHFSRSSLMGG